ncbi:uncharacterized protein BJ171DRAFT_500765 [Polychytrium aggregatum]|uniref:uncharacterized protein n=1 Tax=Polychytrium aggregatum TaxID=110093 RepID=UPI0022FE62E9|nr:uncharacterized protein BJ171DRAFT_500765 [Polychytrium aggregatum]KAI9205556.1 hypothetical protein BJ171DRAFT_500765 [Polychytrium aggregatum]
MVPADPHVGGVSIASRPPPRPSEPSPPSATLPGLLFVHPWSHKPSSWTQLARSWSRLDLGSQARLLFGSNSNSNQPPCSSKSHGDCLRLGPLPRVRRGLSVVRYEPNKPFPLPDPLHMNLDPHLAANITLLVHHQAGLYSPRCAWGVLGHTKNASLLVQNLGDAATVINRCLCDTTCGFYTSPSADQYAYRSCGQDPTCAPAHCLPATTNPPTAIKCNTDIKIQSWGDYAAMASSPVPASDPDFFSNFNTTVFAFRTTSMSANCVLGGGSFFQIERVPIYPMCSRILNNYYALTVIEKDDYRQYACTDPDCFHCQSANAYEIGRPACVRVPEAVPAMSSSRMAGWILAQSNVQLAKSLPGSPSVSPTPTRPGGPTQTSPGATGDSGGSHAASSNSDNGRTPTATLGYAIGGTAAALLISLAAGLLLWRRRHKKYSAGGPRAFRVEQLGPAPTASYQPPWTRCTPPALPASLVDDDPSPSERSSSVWIPLSSLDDLRPRESVSRLSALAPHTSDSENPRAQLTEAQTDRADSPRIIRTRRSFTQWLQSESPFRSSPSAFVVDADCIQSAPVIASSPSPEPDSATASEATGESESVNVDLVDRPISGSSQSRRSLLNLRVWRTSTSRSFPSPSSSSRRLLRQSRASNWTIYDLFTDRQGLPRQVSSDRLPDASSAAARPVAAGGEGTCSTPHSPSISEAAPSLPSSSRSPEYLRVLEHPHSYLQPQSYEGHSPETRLRAHSSPYLYSSSQLPPLFAQPLSQSQMQLQLQLQQPMFPLQSASSQPRVSSTYVAVVNYEPKNIHEISLATGDTLELVVRLNENYAQVRNTSSGAAGIVDLSHIQLSTVHSPGHDAEGRGDFVDVAGGNSPIIGDPDDRPPEYSYF